MYYQTLIQQTATEGASCQQNVSALFRSLLLITVLHM